MTDGPDQREAVAAYLTGHGLDHARRGEAFVFAIPTEARGPGGVLAAALVPGREVVAFSSFVIRGADRDRDRFYGLLLRKNAACHGWAFCLDAHGDVWARGEVDADPLRVEALDRLLGSFVDVVETAWHALLEAGFEIRR